MIRVKTDKGYVFKEDLEVWNECIMRTYRDPEIGINLIHVFRIINHYKDVRDMLMFEDSRKFLANLLVFDFRRITKERDGNYLYDVVDFITSNDFSWAHVPYFLTAFTFPEDVKYDAYGSILDVMKLKSYELDKKEYKYYPKLKIFVPAKKYVEIYNALHEEIEFLTNQIGNVIGYIFKNNIDIDDVDNVFKYIMNNINSLYEYVNLNKPNEDDDKEEEFIIRTVEKILADYKKPSKLLLK